MEQIIESLEKMKAECSTEWERHNISAAITYLVTSQNPPVEEEAETGDNEES